MRWLRRTLHQHRDVIGLYRRGEMFIAFVLPFILMLPNIFDPIHTDIAHFFAFLCTRFGILLLGLDEPFYFRAAVFHHHVTHMPKAYMAVWIQKVLFV